MTGLMHMKTGTCEARVLQVKIPLLSRYSTVPTASLQGRQQKERTMG